MSSGSRRRLGAKSRLSWLGNQCEVARFHFLIRETHLPGRVSAYDVRRSRTAESIQDFVQRFPQYANPSTRPPVLRPLTAEILSRCDPSSGGFMANVFDRSLFPPQAVRTGALDLEMAHSYAPPPAPGLTPRETASVHHSRRRTDGEHADLTSLYVPAQPVKRRSSGRITSDVATNGRVDHAKDR